MVKKLLGLFFIIGLIIANNIFAIDISPFRFQSVQIKSYLALNESVPIDASAALAIGGTDKGFLLPRMTAAQRDAIVNPANGLQIFNTDDNEIYFYTGAAWESLRSTQGEFLNRIYTEHSTVTRLEWLYVGFSGSTPSVNQSSGDWLNATPLTDNGIGSTVVNFKSGMFDNAPACVCTCNAASGNADRHNCSFGTESTISGIEVNTGETDADFSFTDTPFFLICIGDTTL